MYNFLFLDDERTPVDASNYMTPVELRAFYRSVDWFIVRSYDEFVAQITKHGTPPILSVDHDLGRNEKTGYECCVWLIDFCNKRNIVIPEIYCHSLNPDGNAQILQLISSVNRFFK